MSHPSKVKGPSPRRFGIEFGLLFAAIGLIPIFKHHPPKLWAFGISGALLVIAAVAPGVLKYPNKFWTIVGSIVQRVMTPIIMSVLFFAIITPFAILMRIFGKDLLRLKKTSDATYWIKRDPPGPAPDTMKFQF